jgi:hypothetical protein
LLWPLRRLRDMPANDLSGGTLHSAGGA